MGRSAKARFDAEYYMSFMPPAPTHADICRAADMIAIWSTPLGPDYLRQYLDNTATRIAP